jgi:DNA invertase Pin-like site-specific DNA recombinase
MESQTDTVRRFVEKAGGTVISEYCEVESGGKTDRDRQELSKALSECRRVRATLVVAKLDRLSRNAEFLLSLQNGNVDFVCCDCPNVDRFTVGILALVAQRERELISERTKSALQMAKRRGVHLGTRNPMKQVNLMVAGARKAKTDFKAKLTPLIEEIRQTGVSTLQGIADCLNRRGIPTRTGKAVWYPTTVKNMG